MQYKLNKGENSHFETIVTMTTKEKEKLTNSVLRGFQKEMTKPGFRKGHVPLDMVKDMVNPMYMVMGVYEEVIHKSMKLILEENDTLQFIGQPYDLQTENFETEDKDGNVSLGFKMDVYPEAEIVNDSRKKKTLTPVDVSLTDEEINDVLTNMQRQYADYEDQEEVTETTIAKIKLHYKDAEGNEIEKGSVFAGPEDYAEYKSFKEHFAGKKMSETFDIPYSNDLPKVLLAKKPEGVQTITCTISDNKKQVLPEFTDEMIAKLFPDQEEIKTKDDLITKINTTLLEQKAEKALLENVDTLLKDIEGSIHVAAPQTLVTEEMKSRKEQIAKQYGGVEAFDKIMENQGEEQKKAFDVDLRKASKEALQKYIRLNKLVELNELTVDRNASLDVEKKLYKAHTGQDFSTSYEKETTKKIEKKAEKKATDKKTTKKAPAKKKADK